MTVVTSSVDIARPPEEVFAYVTDPSRFAEWQHGVVEGHVEGEQTVGSYCTVTRHIGGRARTAHSVLTELQPPRRWFMHGIDGPIRTDVAVTVEPQPEAGASHVTIELDIHGHGLGKLIAPLVLSQVRKDMPPSCSKLKERLERHSPGPATRRDGPEEHPEEQ